MLEVTKDEFFATLYADKRDIMPSQRNSDFTVWETPNRVVFGRTYPGWKNPGGPKRYLLAQPPVRVGAPAGEQGVLGT